MLQGDCIEVMAGLEESSVDAVVCDPPYGIGWQNERWDSGAIREAAARRGHGRAGASESFEAWCGMWGEECLRVMKPGAYLVAFGAARTHHRLACGLESAGLEIRDTLMWLYGNGALRSRRHPGGRLTMLKPAVEPIVLARRPLQGTTTETIERHGTGALNAEACRVNGRLPANLVLSHQDRCEEGRCAAGCPVELLDDQADGHRDGRRPGPSRFFYCAKASRAERDAGCEALPHEAFDMFSGFGRRATDTETGNPHPTVKPLELMRWLVRLVCPVTGLVLDPFMGSGTTGVAAALEGRRFCGIELAESYLKIAAARIAHWSPAGRGGAADAVPSGRRR
jgi:DNA modification methylase